MYKYNNKIKLNVMSKKEELVKLNADELVVIQELNQKFMQTKVAIADAVIQQQQLVAELSEVQKDFKKQEKYLQKNMVRTLL